MTFIMFLTNDVFDKKTFTISYTHSFSGEIT